MRAVEARAADDDAAADRGGAAPARWAGAVVDGVAELEPAGAAEAVDVVRDRRAAAVDRFGEHRLGAGDQALAVRAPERAGPAAGAHAGPEQDLVHVDVAEAGDPAL